MFINPSNGGVSVSATLLTRHESLPRTTGARPGLSTPGPSPSLGRRGLVHSHPGDLGQVQANSRGASQGSSTRRIPVPCAAARYDIPKSGCGGDLHRQSLGQQSGPVCRHQGTATCPVHWVARFSVGTQAREAGRAPARVQDPFCLLLGAVGPAGCSVSGRATPVGPWLLACSGSPGGALRRGRHDRPER
jgi:hypothetical protein